MCDFVIKVAFVSQNFDPLKNVDIELEKEKVVSQNFSSFSGFYDFFDSEVDIASILIEWEWNLPVIADELDKYLIPSENFHSHSSPPISVRDKLVKKGFIFHPDFDIGILNSLKSWEEVLTFINLNRQYVTATPSYLIKKIRKKNSKLPIFLFTEKNAIDIIPTIVLENIQGYIWKKEDTPIFIARRIIHSSHDYLKEILPPFFTELLKYVKDGNYSWHTPGHSGGSAFRHSAPGKLFFDFLGENVFRSDISVSVSDLGSLMDHTGYIGEAEEYASQVFGADKTFFVTNGTSTANKIVFQSVVGHNDLVVLDRNSHKSSMHIIQMLNAFPIYLKPTRNSYGIMGPVSFNQFSEAHIRKGIKNTPFIKAKDMSLKLLILTNSTYDGICYNVNKLCNLLPKFDAVLFDEAWFGYAHFHPFYSIWHAMSHHYCDPESKEKKEFKEDKSCYPGAIFATQSTHKVLAALSQASMIHCTNVRDPFYYEKFNNTYIMHTSTSPQYNILASLDVSSAMMDLSGSSIVYESLKEAVSFREKMERIKQFSEKSKTWWFGVWQPPGILEYPHPSKDPNFWILPPSSEGAWHGFEGIEENQFLLDPLKVSILTSTRDCKIPAFIVSKYFTQQGINVEKCGFYTLLILFTTGGSKGKTGTLLATLHNFKRLYDDNVKLYSIFPQLTQHGSLYKKMKLKEFCEKMIAYIDVAEDLESRIQKVTSKQAMSPNEAYFAYIHNNFEWVEIQKLKDRISATLIVPYPPGVPMIIPGEVFNKEQTELINNYIGLGKLFPGFSLEIIGVIEKDDKNYIACVKE